MVINSCYKHESVFVIVAVYIGIWIFSCLCVFLFNLMNILGRSFWRGTASV